MTVLGLTSRNAHHGSRTLHWQLANHTSGLPAHVRFYEEAGPRVLHHGNFAKEYRWVLDTIYQTPPAYTPAQTRSTATSVTSSWHTSVKRFPHR